MEDASDTCLGINEEKPQINQPNEPRRVHGAKVAKGGVLSRAPGAHGDEPIARGSHHKATARLFAERKPGASLIAGDDDLALPQLSYPRRREAKELGQFARRDLCFHHVSNPTPACARAEPYLIQREFSACRLISFFYLLPYCASGADASLTRFAPFLWASCCV